MSCSLICTTRAQKSCPCVQNWNPSSLSFAPAGGRHHRAELDLGHPGTRPAASLGCCVCVVPSGMGWGLVQVPRSGGKVGGGGKSDKRLNPLVFRGTCSSEYIRSIKVVDTRVSIGQIVITYYRYNSNRFSCNKPFLKTVDLFRGPAKYGTGSGKKGKKEKTRYILTSATFLPVY